MSYFIVTVYTLGLLLCVHLNFSAWMFFLRILSSSRLWPHHSPSSKWGAGFPSQVEPRHPSSLFPTQLQPELHPWIFSLRVCFPLSFWKSHSWRQGQSPITPRKPARWGMAFNCGWWSLWGQGSRLHSSEQQGTIGMKWANATGRAS